MQPPRSNAARNPPSEPRLARAQLEYSQGRKRAVQPMQLDLRQVARGEVHDSVQSLTFETDDGRYAARYHAVTPTPGRQLRGAVWVGGAGGGLDGPARGLYPEACGRLQAMGVAGLRIDYRRPGDLVACVLDTLLAVAFLRSEQVDRIALVGHSFGGAVVISAGALSAEVTAVVPLSTQTYGTDLAADVSPRPMLIVHGTDDEVLPSRCSELVHAAAREPKELRLFPGARHGLDEVREDVLSLVVLWLARHI